jgi:hypothetical protein
MTGRIVVEWPVETGAGRLRFRKGRVMKIPTCGRRVFSRRAAFVSLVLVSVAVALTGARAAGANIYTAGTPVDTSAGASPFVGCTVDNAAVQQTFSTLFTNAQPEPRVAVNPTNPMNIVGAYHQDRWNNGGNRGMSFSVSHDGGATWTRSVMPGVSRCSDGAYDRASDPWVTFTPNGVAYAISLSFDVFDPNNAVLVLKSTNGGNTWSAPIPLIADTFLGSGNDKESITADPTDPSGNLVYAVWDRFISPPSGIAADQGVFRARAFRQQAWFSRTTNGGVSWEPARPIYNPGTFAATIGNVIQVVSNGDLVDGLVVFHFKPTLRLEVAVIRSSDKGVSWSKHATTVAPLDTSFPGAHDPDNGNPIRSGGLPDFATGPNNTLYAVWEDDHPTAGVDAIQFSQSTDGGLTWSDPIKINKTPTNIPAGDQQAFTPTIKVASDGTIGVTYYDLRNNTPAPGLPTDYWFVHCHASCTSASNWSETHVAGSFDLEQAAVARGYFLGDYEGLDTFGNSFAAFFDEAGLSQAIDPSDVYFSKITPSP